MTRMAVVAVGGNALTHDDEAGTSDQIEANAAATAAGIAQMHRQGWRVLVVHGNGPQVGNLAIQQEDGVDDVPPQPLSSLNAMSQGQLGSVLVRAIDAELGPGSAVAIVTHVTVDLDDPAFDNPTKPIGPFFDATAAADLEKERNWAMAEDAGRGYRRHVASPKPIDILETSAIQALVNDGHVVVACGGGGVGVDPTSKGFAGVEAVIDKDAAAARLAISLRADAVLLVTAVDNVWLDFNTDKERQVNEMTLDEARQHLAEGQFPAGSMGPKVQAAIDYVDKVGGAAVITSADHLLDGVDPNVLVGTRIVPTSVMSHL